MFVLPMLMMLLPFQDTVLVDLVAGLSWGSCAPHAQANTNFWDPTSRHCLLRLPSAHVNRVSSQRARFSTSPRQLGCWGPMFSNCTLRLRSARFSPELAKGSFLNMPPPAGLLGPHV